MAEKRTGGKGPLGKNLLGNIRRIIDLLPSDKEKREMQENILVLLDFFSDLKKRLDMLPTSESYEDARRSLLKLEESLTKAKSNLVLSSVLGIKNVTKSQPKREDLSENEVEAARNYLTRLEALSIENIRDTLKDEENFSTRRLQGLIAAMGIRTSKKLGRDALTDLIATKISNYRGYKILRGENEMKIHDK